MRLKHLWLCLAAGFITASPALSQTQKPKFLFDATVASKYMMDGYNVGGNNPVLQLTAIANLFSSDFSFMYWNSLQINRSNREHDEHDFFLRYSRNFFEGHALKTNFHGYYDYWMFPNATERKHGNKFQLGVSFPEALPLFESHLIPTYNVYLLRYWAQDRKDLDMGGFEHELMIEYSQGIAKFLDSADYQYATVATSTVYTEGTFGVKPGFSHSILKLETGVYALQSIFIGSVNYQWSYKADINDGNELWPTLSYVKKF